MVGAQLRRQFNHRCAELLNQQIRLGRQHLKTIVAGLIAPPQRTNEALQRAEAADSQCKIRCLRCKLLEGCLDGLGP